MVFLRPEISRYFCVLVSDFAKQRHCYRFLCRLSNIFTSLYSRRSFEFDYWIFAICDRSWEFYSSCDWLILITNLPFVSKRLTCVSKFLRNEQRLIANKDIHVLTQFWFIENRVNSLNFWIHNRYNLVIFLQLT